MMPKYMHRALPKLPAITNVLSETPNVDSGSNSLIVTVRIITDFLTQIGTFPNRLHSLQGDFSEISISCASH